MISKADKLNLLKHIVTCLIKYQILTPNECLKYLKDFVKLSSENRQKLIKLDPPETLNKSISYLASYRDKLIDLKNKNALEDYLKKLFTRIENLNDKNTLMDIAEEITCPSAMLASDYRFKVRHKESTRSIMENALEEGLKEGSEKEFYDQVFTLINEHHFDINSQDENGNTLLHEAIYKKKRWANFLLALPESKFNIPNKKGETVAAIIIKDAIASNDPSFLEYLKVRDYDFNTPLLNLENLSTLSNLTKILKKNNLHKEAAFLQKDDKLSDILYSISENVLLLAIAKDKIEIVKFLLTTNINLNPKNADLPPLHFAILYSRKLSIKQNIIEVLLDHGADPNLLDKNGEAPLTLALLEDDYKTVNFLLKSNANINACYEDGVPILSTFIAEGEHKISTFLIENNADVNLKLPESNVCLRTKISEFTKIPLTCSATKIAAKELLQVDNYGYASNFTLAFETNNKKLIVLMLNKGYKITYLDFMKGCEFDSFDKSILSHITVDLELVQTFRKLNYLIRFYRFHTETAIKERFDELLEFLEDKIEDFIASTNVDYPSMMYILNELELYKEETEKIFKLTQQHWNSPSVDTNALIKERYTNSISIEINNIFELSRSNPSFPKIPTWLYEFHYQDKFQNKSLDECFETLQKITQWKETVLIKLTKGIKTEDDSILVEAANIIPPKPIEEKFSTYFRIDFKNLEGLYSIENSEHYKLIFHPECIANLKRISEYQGRFELMLKQLRFCADKKEQGITKIKEKVPCDGTINGWPLKDYYITHKIKLLGNKARILLLKIPPDKDTVGPKLLLACFARSPSDHDKPLKKRYTIEVDLPQKQVAEIFLETSSSLT